MKSNSIIYSNFNSTTFLPNCEVNNFHLLSVLGFLFGSLWWGLQLCCDFWWFFATSPPTLPSCQWLREKVSLMFATMYIFYPTTSDFNSPFLHFNLKKFQANQPKLAILFLCLQTHSSTHLFNKLGAYCLPGTVLGARNRMESKTRHHSCLPEAYNLSGRWKWTSNHRHEV